MTTYEILGWATTIFFNVSYIPQLWKIYQTKKVEDISPGYIVLLLAAYTCGLLYSGSIKAWPIIYSHLIGMAFSVWYLLLYIKYKKRRRHV